jgi:hypothetical protein
MPLDVWTRSAAAIRSLPKMRVIVSASAAEAINGKGGRLYVWLRRGQCCRGTTTLDAATSPPAGKEFRREKAATSFELYIPAHLAQLPDELHIDAEGRSQRIKAYWNGCAWVV